jgi:hypothetical protein
MASTRINGRMLGSGSVIQVVSQQFSSLATGTGIIPADDTIPQISEGFEVMNLSITPKSATSILRVDAVFTGAYNVSHGNMVLAVFRDATADALGAVNFGHSASFGKTYGLTVVATSGSLNLTTFRVRTGSTDGSTVTFNGSDSARKFGGKAGSSITITEIAA